MRAATSTQAYTKEGINAICIAIAEDHPLMRAALKEAISAHIEGAALAEAFSVALLGDKPVSEAAIDAVLLDLKIPVYEAPRFIQTTRWPRSLHARAGTVKNV